MFTCPELHRGLAFQLGGNIFSTWISLNKTTSFFRAGCFCFWRSFSRIIVPFCALFRTYLSTLQRSTYGVHQPIYLSYLFWAFLTLYTTLDPTGFPPYCTYSKSHWTISLPQANRPHSEKCRHCLTFVWAFVLCMTSWMLHVMTIFGKICIVGKFYINFDF